MTNSGNLYEALYNSVEVASDTPDSANTWTQHTLTFAGDRER
jgi:hypothetical protein